MVFVLGLHRQGLLNASLREGISLRPCCLPGLPALLLGLSRENSCWSLTPQKPQGDAIMEVHGASSLGHKGWWGQDG